MSKSQEFEKNITDLEQALIELDHRRSQILSELTQLRRYQQGQDSPSQLSLHIDRVSLDNQSSQEEKIRLFRSYFKGREDVFPRRFKSLKTGKSGYTPVCRNEWKTGVCQKPKITCRKCAFREFEPVHDEIVRNHLMGTDPRERAGNDYTVGVYPLLVDETCWFLAVDFDKATWTEDVKYFLETCETYHVPVVLERSRSGNGSHVWVFFETPVPAILARKLGSMLLTKTLNRRPEIGLDSYDRLFPSQDTLPRGGFGNLIALPLQKKPREKGNSVFVDQDFNPYPDQWAFLSSVQKMTEQALENLLETIGDEGEIIGVRSVLSDEDQNEPWKLLPSGKSKDPLPLGFLPDKLSLILSNQIYIEKAALPAPLRNHIIRLAAFQNPEFFKAQAMRLSTFGKPRIISCCEDYPNHLALPRGCQEDLLQRLSDLNINTELTDERNMGDPIAVDFQGRLRPEQQLAAGKLVEHDIGVLSASTAFGKTVIGAWLIAHRKVNTLVIVHRRQLMDQWIENLQLFLGLTKKEIGQIGGGKQKLTGKVDVAMIQSLVRKGTVKDLVGDYGQIIVDECHHISAVSFEQAIRRAKARYITGLSATVTRRDGHHPIIFMQCGPVRYRVDARQQAASRPFHHQVFVRKTGFSLPEAEGQKSQPGIQEIYSLLVSNEARNQKIINDVVKAVRDGRSPVLLTERREHLAFFEERLTGRIKNIFVLSGGMGDKKRNKLMDALKLVPEHEERLILATGRYLGEGFDDARLDTLFLSLPVSWRGTVAQYAGRLHRDYDQKREVIIYDYVDDKVPVLARMYKKRVKGYKAIGYELS